MTCDVMSHGEAARRRETDRQTVNDRITLRKTDRSAVPLGRVLVASGRQQQCSITVHTINLILTLAFTASEF